MFIISSTGANQKKTLPVHLNKISNRAFSMRFFFRHLRSIVYLDETSVLESINDQRHRIKRWLNKNKSLIDAHQCDDALHHIQGELEEMNELLNELMESKKKEKHLAA